MYLKHGPISVIRTLKLTLFCCIRQKTCCDRVILRRRHTNRKVQDILRTHRHPKCYISRFTYEELSACLGILFRYDSDRDNFNSLADMIQPKRRAVLSSRDLEAQVQVLPPIAQFVWILIIPATFGLLVTN